MTSPKSPSSNRLNGHRSNVALDIACLELLSEDSGQSVSEGESSNLLLRIDFLESKTEEQSLVSPRISIPSAHHVALRRSKGLGCTSLPTGTVYKVSLHPRFVCLNLTPRKIAI